MARQIRKKSGTGIYHIMLRGIPLMIQSLEKVRRNEILITAKAMGIDRRFVWCYTKVVMMKIIRSARLCRFAKQRNDPHDPRHLCRKNEN